MDKAVYSLGAVLFCVGILGVWLKYLENAFKEIILMLNTRVELLEAEIQSLRTSSKMTQIRHDLLSKRVNRNLSDGQRDLS